MFNFDEVLRLEQLGDADQHLLPLCLDEVGY
jgi:hypothetical protein